MSGWIKLHRSLLKWEWYDDPNTCRLFIHLLLTANHAPRNWRKTVIGRGQILTSRAKIKQETGLSDRQIRTCLERLQSTNEVTIQSTNVNSIITICNYDTYQITDDMNDQPNDQQSAIRTTSKRPTITQEDKEGEEEKNSSTAASADANGGEIWISSKKRKLKGKRLAAFKEFWKAFGFARGRAAAIDSWLDIPELTDALVTEICESARMESVERPSILANGKTPIYAQGWITARRWEDEPLGTSARATVIDEPKWKWQEIRDEYVDRGDVSYSGKEWSELSKTQQSSIMRLQRR